MLITLVVLGGYLYLRLDDEIRRYAEGVLADHYDHLDVRLGSARFTAGRGVALYNLTLSERQPGGGLQTLVVVDELQLLGQFDVESLAAGKPVIRQIVVKQPRLQAIRGRDRRWNVAALLPLPPAGEKPAAVKIVDAAVTLTDQLSSTPRPLTLREINLDVTCPSPEAESPGGNTYHIAGTLGGGLANSFRVQAEFQPDTGAVAAGAEITGLDLTPNLLRSLPGIDPGLLERGELTGKANLHISVQRSSEPDAALTWTAEFQLLDGRVTLDGLPRQITNVTATGSATESQLKVTEARANYGKTDLLLACTRYGWQPAAPLGLTASARRLMLDNSLADSLPAGLARVWGRFRPVGEVDALLTARFVNGQWQPDLTVTCHDVAFEDQEKFPYRLRQGSGTVRIVDQGDGAGFRLNVQLQAAANGSPVELTGELAGLPGVKQAGHDHEHPPPSGWFEVHGTAVPIDEELITALDERARRVVHALDAKGNCSVRWRIERRSPRTDATTETELTFHDCQVQLEDFPYPLTHVKGRALERDQNWRFENLVSRDPHGQREIRVAGTCMDNEQGHLLALNITGTNVPLDETLRLALPAEQQQAWSAIRPRGQVDFRCVVQHQLGANTKPEIYIDVHPQHDSVTIEPTFFPYRLDRVRGRIEIEGGNVTLTGIEAAHDQTTVSCDGMLTPTTNGGWQFELTKLHVDRMSANYDLKHAVPLGLLKVIEYLNPTGNFSIHNGHLRYTKPTAAAPQIVSDWNVQIGCQQNSLRVGVPLRGVSGRIHLAGSQGGQRTFAAGQLYLETAFWNGMQLTGIRGPLWVDTNEFRLGRGATQRMNELHHESRPLERLEADLYGGRLVLDANVKLDANARYTVGGRLDDADLHRMSTEYMGGASELSGKLSGEVTLTGTGHAIDRMEGGGWAKISNASLYELPLMASLLKVLRNRVPDKTAFNEVEAEFTLEGNDITFKALNLLGDAVSLYGKGHATFDQRLDLVFHSTFGRNNIGIPLFRSMIGQASANLMLLRVTGPADNPKVTPEPLPAVNEFVEQLGEGPLTTPPGPLNGSRRR